MNAFRRLVAGCPLVDFCKIGSLVLALLLAAPVQASTSGARWACWYEPANLTVRCLLSRAPDADHEARAAEVERTIDRRLSPLVRTLWGSPEALAEHMISIPLWNAPYEMDFAAELADAVMCGSRKECSVHFDANADGRAPVRAAALRSGASEADVMAELVNQGIVLAAANLTAGEVPEKRRSARRRRTLNS